MAEQNFKVKHGLSVGSNDIIDANGNVTVPGVLTANDVVASGNSPFTVTVDTGEGLSTMSYDGTLTVEGQISVGNTAYQSDFIGTSGSTIGIGSWSTGKSTDFNADGTIDIQGSILPKVDIAYDLGSATNRFRDLYLSGATLHIGDTKLTRNSTTGDVEIADASTGELKNIKVKQIEIDDVVADPDYTIVMKRIDGNVQFVVKDRTTGVESVASVDLTNSDVYDSATVDGMMDDLISQIEYMATQP